jgi:hypothetical protein
LPRTPDFRLPRTRRISWPAIAISLLVHSLLLFVVIEGRPPDEVHRPHVIFFTPELPDQATAVPMPYRKPKPYLGTSVTPRPQTPVNPKPIPQPELAVEAPAPPGVDSVPRRAAAERIGPELGNGRLWVRPLPLPPQELAQRLNKTNAELVDSAVSAIIQQFLDSVANEPGADQAKMPDWTTEVAGKKFGLDSKNIYLAGLKIPAAVLALLPLPTGGNQQHALDHNDWILQDLHEASARATTLAEFKEAIRQLRKKKEEEREFEKNSHTDPDSAAEQKP